MAWRTRAISIFTGAVILGASLAAEGAVLQFREGGGDGFVDTVFDDTRVAIDNATATAYGNDSNLMITTNNLSYRSVALIGIKDLFSFLPAMDPGGDALKINSAMLHLNKYNTGDSGVILNVFRVTTDWMPNPAGNNENNISGMYVDNANETAWAAGGAFTDADIDTTNVAIANFVDSGFVSIDVTDLVRRIYEEGENYGFAVTIAKQAGQGGVNANFRASENQLNNRPWLAIDYGYIPEPASLGFLGLGGLILCHRRRRA